MQNIKNITIKSEADFLELAKNILLAEKPPVFNIKFEGWPYVNMYMQGENYHQSLPISAMEGFVDFQQSLYRMFADLRYNTPNLQFLKAEEKRDLELTFTIKDGSSDTEANIADWLNKIIDKLDVVFAGMTGDEKMLLILGLAGITAGTWMFISWLNKKTEVSNFKDQQDTIRAAIDSNKATTDGAFGMLKELMAIHPSNNGLIDKISKHVDNGYSDFLKKVPDADYVKVGNSEFRGNEIRDFSRRRAYNRSKPKECCDMFYVDGVKKSSDRESYLINLVRVSDDLPVSMKAFATIVTSDELDTLLNAIKNDDQVNICFTAIMSGSDIQHAQFNHIVEDDDQSQTA